MGVNFSTDFCIKGKATRFEFNRVMRLNGEYHKAQLDGLYLRYLTDDAPEYVTKAMKHATIYTHESLDEMFPRERQMVQKSLRRQAILGVLQMAQRPLSVDEIVPLVGMGMTHRQVVIDARRLIIDRQVTTKTGRNGHRYYRAVEVPA